jgi:hypothetical protein
MAAKEKLMNQQTLMISQALYERLAVKSQLCGLSIEQLLEEWERRDAEISQRQEVGKRIDALRERIFAQYGEMPDSTELLREDRAR